MSTQSPRSPHAPSASTTVQVGVTINAEPETVWRFLSEQDKLLAWMTAIPGSPIPTGSTFEPRVGGTLRIIFPNGGEARGSVLEIEPLRKLVFTWGYEPDVAKTGLGAGACRVEIAMTALDGGGTRVTLTHSGPMSKQIAAEHVGGWRHYLSQLALNSTRQQFEPGLPNLMRSYFAAWNERDDARRLAMLTECCDAAVRVRTTFACCDGIDDFSAHVGNGLKHMPGVTLTADGPAQQQHGFVRFGWAVKMHDGKGMFSGQNFARLTPGGKIVELVGFMNGA